MQDCFKLPRIAKGALCIHGARLKPGIELSETTVPTFMAKRRQPPSQAWHSEDGRGHLDGAIDIANRVLLALPPAALKRIQPALESLNMVRGQVIYRADTPIEHLYFINRGLVSLVKTMRDGRTVEVGAVGIEGVTDPMALFGIDTAILESVVRIPGTAFRIRRDVLRVEMAKNAALRKTMQRYAHFAASELVQTAACNGLHSLEERCARWLLIAHDNALSETFPLTHEFLAMTLGVQRAGVSIASNFLRKIGLIRYTRGRVTVTNRSGLEAAACECYDAIRAQLDSLFDTA